MKDLLDFYAIITPLIRTKAKLCFAEISEGYWGEPYPAVDGMKQPRQLGNHILNFVNGNILAYPT